MKREKADFYTVLNKKGLKKPLVSCFFKNIFGASALQLWQKSCQL